MAGEKTEKPTHRRIKDARDKGQVPRSRDLVGACSLLAVTGMLAWLGPHVISGLLARLTAALQQLGDAPRATLSIADLTTTVAIGRVAARHARRTAHARGGGDRGRRQLRRRCGWVFAPQALQFELGPAESGERPEAARALAGRRQRAQGAAGGRDARRHRLAARLGADRAGHGPRQHGAVRARRARLGRDVASGRARRSRAAGVRRRRLRGAALADDDVAEDVAAGTQRRSPVERRQPRNQVTRPQASSARWRASGCSRRSSGRPSSSPTRRTSRSRSNTGATRWPRRSSSRRARTIWRCASARSRARTACPIVENIALARALYKTAEVGDTIPASLFGAIAEVLAYLVRIKQLAL